MSDRLTLIRNALVTSLSPSTLEIIDDSHHHIGHVGSQDGAGHYTVTLVSTLFCGLSTLTRHRLVYQAVETLMPHHIHALSIKAFSPEEYSSNESL